MFRKEKNGIKWLEFEIFQPYKELKHGVLSRMGGCSPTPYSSLNMNVLGENELQDIQENLTKVRSTFSLEKPIFAKQVHGPSIEIINTMNKNRPFECDGFITDQLYVPLFIKHADCQAALFYDPIKKVIAAIHCGWRGNVQNIYKNCIQTLNKEFGCNPENILVGISPSLGPNHSEFRNYLTEFPKEFWDKQIKPYYFNLWDIALEQLICAGIKEQHIEIAKICTYENHKEFFSYRKNKNTGRNATFISLL